MNEPINMIRLAHDLAARPRGRACIVFTHEFAGQKEWAAELARQTGSAHIDLLELFVEDKSLCEEISHFSVTRLFEFLKDRSDKPVLVVSGLEFLKATWAGQSNSSAQFASFVETWHHKPGLIFALQYDKNIAAHKFRRFRHYTFLVDQKETLAL